VFVLSREWVKETPMNFLDLLWIFFAVSAADAGA